MAIEPPPNGFDLLTLDMDNGSELADILDLLNALHNLYLNICEKLGLDQNDHPLSVARIEAGSLSVVIKATKLVTDTFKFIINVATPFTRIGRLKTAEAYVGTLSKYPALLKHLHEHGHDAAAQNTMLADLVDSGLRELKELAPRVRKINNVPVDSEVIAYLKSLEQQAEPQRLIEGPKETPSEGEPRATEPS